MRLRQCCFIIADNPFTPRRFRKNRTFKEQMSLNRIMRTIQTFESRNCGDGNVFEWGKRQPVLLAQVPLVKPVINGDDVARGGTEPRVKELIV